MIIIAIWMLLVMAHLEHSLDRFKSDSLSMLAAIESGSKVSFLSNTISLGVYTKSVDVECARAQ